MKKTVFKILIIAIVASSTAFAYEFRRAKNLDDVYDASCRVSVANARGSGVFVGVDESTGSALILTNFHVVQNFQAATLEFWRDGVPVPIKGATSWRYYDSTLPADYAIVAIDAGKLEEIDAPFVALGGPDCAPTPAAFFISAGCPKGSHVWSWKGVWRNVSRTAEFQPAPYPGQSGSGLFEFRDGELWYVGTLTWLVGDEGDDRAKGAAIPVANLYRAISRRSYSPSFLDVLDSTPFQIPSDYKEIAAKPTYSLVEYTRDACPACVEAEEDVRILLNSGVYCAVVNTSKGDGLKKAKADGVEACPTFVLKDLKGTIVERWVGAGYGDEIADRIAKDFPNKQEEKPKAVDDLALALPAIEVAPDPTPLPTIEFKAEPDEDFRDRLPVRERYDGSFFDDAARRWTDRNKSTPEKGEEEAPARPKIFGEKGEEEPDDAKIGDKLADRIGAAIASRLEPIANEFRLKIEEKEEAIRSEIAVKVRALAWKLLGCFFVAFLLAALLYDTIKAAAIAVWNWFAKFFRAIESALESAAYDPVVEYEEEPEEEEAAEVEEAEEVPEEVRTAPKKTTKRTAKKK